MTVGGAIVHEHDFVGAALEHSVNPRHQFRQALLFVEERDHMLRSSSGRADAVKSRVSTACWLGLGKIRPLSP